MAIQTGGLFGKTKQSIGNITFANWLGRDVARGKIAKGRTNYNTTQREKQRIFKQVAQASGALGSLIRIGFNAVQGDVTNQNKFVKENYETFNVPADNISINVKLINKVAMEKGLATPVPTISSPDAGQIRIQNAAISALLNGAATKAAWAIVSPETSEIVVSDKAVEVNNTSAVDVTVSGLPAGQYCVYFFNYTGNGSKTSASVSEAITVS